MLAKAGVLGRDCEGSVWVAAWALVLGVVLWLWLSVSVGRRAVRRAGVSVGPSPHGQQTGRRAAVSAGFARALAGRPRVAWGDCGSLRPCVLQERVREYYAFLWEEHRCIDGDPTPFVRELSPAIRAEVDLFLKRALITKSDLFRSASVEFVRDLSAHLELVFYLRGDFVVREGEAGQGSRARVGALSARPGPRVPALRLLRCL